MVQMLTTKTNKETCCKCSQLAACALSNWWKCFLNLQVFFSICSACLFLVVLWAFAACALSNWGSCFLNLQVFSEVAARWALSATVQKAIYRLFVASKWQGSITNILIWQMARSAITSYRWLASLNVSQKYELQWGIPDGSKLQFVILMRMKTQWRWCVQGMIIKTFGAFLKTFGASAP